MTLLLSSQAFADGDLTARAEHFWNVATNDRMQLVRSLPKEELEEVLRAAQIESLLRIGERNARALDTYSARVVKRERVNGKLLPHQTMDAVIRQEPLAVRLDFVDGPGKGRKVVYDSKLRKDELRVRESGFLGIAGAVWIDINGSLAKGDTNHPVTDLGLWDPLESTCRHASLSIL